MFAYIWPLALVILSNIIYHICAKNIPEESNSFAVLAVTYLVGAFVSAILYITTNKSGNIIKEVLKMNYAPYLLGLVIVGLEAGYIYAYKAGWQVSTASTVQSCFLAIALIIVGFVMFKEAVTWNKVVGIIICMIGLFFINMK